MYVVEIGSFQWLAETGLQGNGAFAKVFADRDEADKAAQHTRANLTQMLAPFSRKVREGYADAEVTVQPFEALQTRLAACNNPHPMGDAPAARPLSRPVEAQAPRGAGLTAAVRAWAHEHPEATKADALAHFLPLGFNKKTVGIQFTFARNGAR
jgi:hypothetical protein